jgi:NH3-dependent NAD+ synthetase
LPDIDEFQCYVRTSKRQAAVFTLAGGQASAWTLHVGLRFFNAMFCAIGYKAHRKRPAGAGHEKKPASRAVRFARKHRCR